MRKKNILFVSLVAGTGTLLASWSLATLNEPTVHCTWKRCPYYQAPDNECRVYSGDIPKKKVEKLLVDTDAGLILAPVCKPNP
jgi:hypothetical protein